MTALYDYVHEGNIEALQNLLKRDGVTPFKYIHPITGNTLLHEAVKAFEAGQMRPISEDRRLDVAEFLLKEAGIPIDIKNFAGKTPYDLSVDKYGPKNRMTRLLNKLAPNVVSGMQKIDNDAIQQQLFQIARSGNIKAMIEKIDNLSDKVDFNSFRDHTGNTVLMAAVETGQRLMVRLLLNDERLDIDVLVKNKNGESAWDMANDLETEEMLRGAEYEARKD